MFTYTHKIQYYETDKMGVVHHSNYIRWFEEARTDSLDAMGIPFYKLEEMGIITPIVSVNSKYKTMSKFGETVVIESKISKYNGIRLAVAFEVYDEKTRTLRCTGETECCFINTSGKLLNLKKSFPHIHEVFEKNTQI